MVKHTEKRETEAEGIDSTVMSVVVFIVTAAIGLVVLSSIFESLAPETDVDGNYEGAFGEVFHEIENMTGTIYSLLILLPLVLVAAVVIGLLNRRM